MFKENSSQILVRKNQPANGKNKTKLEFDVTTIDDQDWKQFLDKGYASQSLLKVVADKISRGEKLPEREQKVYDFRTKEVDRLIQENEQIFLNESKTKISNYSLPEASQNDLPLEKEAEATEINNKSDLRLTELKKDSLDRIANVNEKIILKAGVVDVSDIVSGRSKRFADEEMTAEKKDLKGIKGFFKKIWNYHYIEQVTHEKKRVEAKKKILEEQNIYSNENLSSEEKAQAGRNFSQLTVERFISDVQGLIESELGEKKEELGTETENERQIRTSLKIIVNDYAEGRLDEAGFEGKKRDIFSGLEKIENQETLKKGEMYVDNFLEVAKQVKEIKEKMSQVAGHQIGVDQIDYEISLTLGKAKDGIKTEAHYNWAEKTIESLRRTRLGSLVNETSLAVGVGIVSSLLTGIGKVSSSRTAAAVTFGLAAGVSGVFAAVKEGQMQKRERVTLETREVIQTGNIRESLIKTRQDIAELQRDRTTTNNKKEIKGLNKELKALQAEEKKLEAQEKYIYERRTAKELLVGLEQASKSANYDELLGQVAEAEARLLLSNEKKIDLIGYSSLVEVERERLDLLKAVSRYKHELFSLKPSDSGDAKDLKNKLQLAIEQRMDQLLDEAGGIRDRDKKFDSHKRKAMGKKFLNNFVVGLGIGVVAQEALSFVNNQEGLVENMIKGDDRVLGSHDTVLQAFNNYLFGTEVTEQVQTVLVENGKVSLPANCGWVANQDGTFNFMRGSDIVAGGLSFNPDGSLTDQAKELLAANDVTISEVPVLIDQGASIPTVTTSPEDYITKNPDSFEEISRQRWNANDTPMYLGEDGKWHGADFNEQRLDWGGDSNTGINTQTNSFEMSAFRMTPDGSFQTVNGEKLSDNATELIREGKMSVLFSLSSETQNQVIKVSIDPTTGKISIPKDSDLGRLLFGEENGRAVLKAKFAEVAMVSGETETGVKQVRLFATAVGEGIKEVPGAAVVSPPLVTTATALGVGSPAIMPPFIPIGSRTPLEKLGSKAALYNIYSAAPIEKERRIEMNRRRSASLEADQKATLDHHQEAKQYLDKLDKKYLKEIEGLAVEAGSMTEGNKLSICIPVAGHQEGTKIYESLKNYTYQTASPDSFEICLLVNHPDRDLNGKKIEPDKTLSEIDRFKKDFPNYNVRVMYKILPREQANIGLVRKLLSDATLLRHYERGGDVEDLIMVSNDADNLGIDPRYIKNFLNRFHKDPKLDGILGQLDWDPEAYVKYPLVHIGTRLFQYYSAYGRSQRGGIVSSGANFAYKSSIYAGVGGYLDGEPGGEDVALGQAIALARGDSRTGKREMNFETQGYGGSASRLFTSARRAIDVLKKYGLAPVNQWNKGFSAFDDDIRRMDISGTIEQKIDFDNKEWLTNFKKNLEQIINQTFDVYEAGEKIGKDNKFYQHNILERLGIKCELSESGELVVTDMRVLIKSLKDYQKYGVSQRDARSGKKEAVEKIEKIRADQKKVDLEAQRVLVSEEKRMIKENKDNLVKFYDNDRLSFQVDNSGLGVPAENEGEVVTALGTEYVNRNQAVISDSANGRITAGYETVSHKLVVIKENEKNGVDKSLPEKYLKSKKVKDESLLLPIKNYEEGNRNLRVYEAAQTDLDKYLMNQPGGRISPREALSIIIRMSNVIGKLHKINMVHGDIHPGNMFVFPDGIKLGDFDEAYIDNFEKQGVGGNRFIMAPEMFVEEGTRKFDKTVDIYALSVSLYKMIVGQWPHEISDSKMSEEEKQLKYSALHRNEKVNYPDFVPKSISLIIDKGLSVKSSDRYRSADYFLNDLLKAYSSL